MVTWCRRAVNLARLSLRAASCTRASPVDAHDSRLCVRGAAGVFVSPSVDRLPPAIAGSSSRRTSAALTRSYSDQKLRPPSFAGCSGTTQSSDSPQPCMSDARHLAWSDRSADSPSSADSCGVSRFPCREFPRMRRTAKPSFRVCDCAGSVGGSPVLPPAVLPSAWVNGVGIPERLISQLDTWPACAPVNASPTALRPSTHDSGSTWLAGPSSGPCAGNRAFGRRPFLGDAHPSQAPATTATPQEAWRQRRPSWRAP